MVLKRIIIFLLIFSSNALSAQNEELIKNLQLRLKNHVQKDTVRVFLLNELAWEYGYIDQNASSAFCREALALSDKLFYDNGRAEAYNMLGNNSRVLGHFDSAYFFHNLALEIRKKQKSKKKLASVYINIANTYYQQKKYSEAIIRYNEAIKMARENDFQNLALVALTSQADAYRFAGLEKQALASLKLALEINNTLKDSLQEPYLYSTMSALLQQMNEEKSAADNAKKALSLLDNHPDVFLKIAVLNNLGTFYRNLQKYDTALSYLNQALKLELENADSSRLCITNNGIALLYQSLGQPDLCLAFAKRARVVAENIKDTVSFYNATLVMADAYIQRRDYKHALELALEVEPLALIINNKKSLFEMYETFANIYEGLNQQDKRAASLVKVISYRDSVLSDENKRLAAKLNIELDVYGKEKEIQLLNKTTELKEVELSKQKAARNFITGIAGLFGLIVLVIVFFYFKIRKSNIIINKQKQKVEAQNEVISHQKHLVEEKQKEIIDSINYAKRIQSAVLTGEDVWNKISKDHFVLFKPKDIVSGDFYWAYNTPNNRSVFALADCTGHGVPGGFMSMLGNSFLNEIVIENKIFNAATILNKLREKIIGALEQKGEEKRKDGMDIALCVWNRLNNTLEFAGANNSMMLMRDKAITELKADKMPIGAYINDQQPFASQTIQLQAGDGIYFTTDGFPDQFGGPKGKKFKYKQTEELILSICHLPMAEQAIILEQKFTEWRGALEQVDDVSLIGIKVP